MLLDYIVWVAYYVGDTTSNAAGRGLTTVQHIKINVVSGKEFDRVESKLIMYSFLYLYHWFDCSSLRS